MPAADLSFPDSIDGAGHIRHDLHKVEINDRNVLLLLRGCLFFGFFWNKI
jgi:hypothetical protein